MYERAGPSGGQRRKRGHFCHERIFEEVNLEFEKENGQKKKITGWRQLVNSRSLTLICTEAKQIMGMSKMLAGGTKGNSGDCGVLESPKRTDSNELCSMHAQGDLASNFFLKQKIEILM